MKHLKKFNKYTTNIKEDIVNELHKPARINFKRLDIYTSKIANKITKFKVGDHVRISKYREAFEKGYTPNWSSEIFIIRKIRLSNPTTYLLQDEAVKHPDAHLVEKVLRKKGNKVFVKWLGYNDKHNSWIDSNNVL
ncbi:hypothetical protein NQ315_011055 [Exocentrus adspersus]|uniref:Chromo domain-containing protein n=1 Tax=Exocentrus adspersus TaxID=1586481 RepID=A0AAV8V8Y6_9CUCU|nr:hypothetical protein NQ315_011055 [Exocentrus adspersus]